MRIRRSAQGASTCTRAVPCPRVPLCWPQLHKLVHVTSRVRLARSDPTLSHLPSNSALLSPPPIQVKRCRGYDSYANHEIADWYLHHLLTFSSISRFSISFAQPDESLFFVGACRRLLPRSLPRSHGEHERSPAQDERPGGSRAASRGC